MIGCYLCDQLSQPIIGNSDTLAEDWCDIISRTFRWLIMLIVFIAAFYDELSTVLESLVLQSGPVIVGGDINIYWLQCSTRSMCSSTLSMLPTTTVVHWTSSPRFLATVSTVWPSIHPVWSQTTVWSRAVSQHIIIPVRCYPASFVAGARSIDRSSLKQSRTASLVVRHRHHRASTSCSQRTTTFYVALPIG